MKVFEFYLGMDQTEPDYFGWRGTDQGAQLKDTGTVHWVDLNTGATNASGFTVLAAGYQWNISEQF